MSGSIPDRRSMKLCSKCNNLKPLEDFFVHKVGRKKGKTFSACKVCESARQKKNREISASKPKITPTNKVCKVCGEDKPIDCFGFWKTTPDGRNHRCKECCANYSYSKDSRSTTTIASKLKLSAEEVERIKASMVSCEVCGASKDDVVLCIDHDHKTGNMRGILCKKCNSGLGFLNDSLETVLALVKYLENNG